MNWSRRHFLSASAGAPLIEIRHTPTIAGEAIATHERQLLLIAMDAIIPAGGNGIPSASEAGGLVYMERLLQREPAMAMQLSQSLRTLEALSARRFERQFNDLEEQDRISVLQELERDAPPQFTLLRDTVYESYYTQPDIWKLIGYTPYPTDHVGPHLKPFDKRCWQMCARG
jgi:hypothetical protein